MDRITKWNRDIPEYNGRFKEPGEIYHRTDRDVALCRNLEVLKRLAQYEDTGLTPTEVELLKKSASEHLLELFHTEIEDRLIVLPVAPGGKLYLPGKSDNGPIALKAVVQWVATSKYMRTGTHFTICVEVEELGGRIYEFSDRLIGKEFFLTEEAAIEKGKERGGAESG